MTSGAVEPADPKPSLRLVLSGAAQLLTNDGLRHALSERDAGILAYIALEGSVSRAVLLDLLWPDVEVRAARAALRQRLFQMRLRTGVEVVAGAELLTLAGDVAVEVGGESADGPLLPGFDFSKFPAFAQWLDRQRSLRQSTRREALVAAAEQAEHEGRLADAIRAAELVVGLDALSEHAHRRLMRLHYLRGDRSAAVAAFERCERILKDELGVGPDAETLSLLALLEGAHVFAPTGARKPLPPTLLRPPRLVGREPQLDAMGRAFAAGHAFMLRGDAGMGKSRLMAAWAHGQPDVMYVQSRPGDAGIAYALLTRLLRSALQVAPPTLDAALRRQLAALLPELRPEGSALDTVEPKNLQRATARLFAQVADAGVTTLLIDDIHYADDASLADLPGLLTAEPSTGLSFGLAQRPAEGASAAMTMCDALLEGGALELINLQPLDAAQMVELVESLELPGIDARLLGPQLVAHSGGNPMFALETLKQTVLRGLGNALPRPATVHQMIERRLHQLSPRALSLARAAAVAGADFSVPLAERLLDANALELADAWQELESAHVLRDDAFAHDLVHEVTWTIVPPAVARRLHARIAEHLESAGMSIERIAHHWCEAQERPRAVLALRAAAELALQKFQRPAALDYLEKAVGYLQDLKRTGEAFALQLDVASLLQGQDSGERHESALERLQQLAVAPAEHVRAGIALAILRHIQGRDDDALASLHRCEWGAAPGSRELSELLNVRGIALRGLGQVAAAIEAHRAALAIARQPEGAQDLAGCLNNLALALLEVDDPGQAARAFNESARLEEDPMTRARVLNNLGIALEEAGDAQAAIETRESALALLRGQDGSEFARANVFISMAGNARSLYRYGDALRFLDEAELAHLPPSHWRTSNLHCHRAATLVDLGAFEDADGAMARAEATATNAVAEGDVLLVRAHYQQARGMNSLPTLRACEQLLKSRSDRRTIRQCCYRMTVSMAPPEAAALATSELERETRHGNRAAQIPFATALARARLAMGSATEALEAARHAIEAMRTASPLLVTSLEVRYVLSQALRAAGLGGADELLLGLASELETIAETNVPPNLRHSFLRRVRLNRQLLQAVSVLKVNGKLAPPAQDDVVARAKSTGPGPRNERS